MKWPQYGSQQKLVMILIMILLCLQQFLFYSTMFCSREESTYYLMTRQYLNNVYAYLWDANVVFNGTTAFIRSQWSKWHEIWLFVHVKPLAPVLASHGANGSENDIIIICWLRKLKCVANWTFYATGYWCQCHIILMASSVAPLYSLHQNDWNEVQHDLLVIAAIGTDVSSKSC